MLRPCWEGRSEECNWYFIREWGFVTPRSGTILSFTWWELTKRLGRQTEHRPQRGSAQLQQRFRALSWPEVAEDNPVEVPKGLGVAGEGSKMRLTQIQQQYTSFSQGFTGSRPSQASRLKWPSQPPAKRIYLSSCIIAKEMDFGRSSVLSYITQPEFFTLDLSLIIYKNKISQERYAHFMSLADIKLSCLNTAPTCTHTRRAQSTAYFSEVSPTPNIYLMDHSSFSYWFARALLILMISIICFVYIHSFTLFSLLWTFSSCLWHL